jgi:excinuclease ABC subunit B
VVEQVVRPTGVVDPPIQIRGTENQIDDLIEEINIRAEKDEKILVTTLTKRMAEELSKYFDRIGIRNRYIHSDVDTLERVEILEELRRGMFDVLIGVNLLREGLDLPEVSLVAVLDADKEGFLRNRRSLTQIAGRAARNLEGQVIFYADQRTDSIRETIAESNRRREKQIRFNMSDSIVPKGAVKSNKTIMVGAGAQGVKYDLADRAKQNMAADVSAQYTAESLDALIRGAREEMERAAKSLDFLKAAEWRDKMYAYQERAEQNKKNKK